MLWQTEITSGSGRLHVRSHLVHLEGHIRSFVPHDKKALLVVYEVRNLPFLESHRASTLGKIQKVNFVYFH